MRGMFRRTKASHLAAFGAAILAFAAGWPDRALALPQPIHEWNFATGTANDLAGTMNGTLNGDATITNGLLVLDGSHNGGGAYMSTAFSTDTLSTMTMVSWVSLSTLSQGGGSALSVSNSSQNFDGIVYGERTSGQWMSGSDGFSRSLVNNGGATVTDLAMHMLAITYSASGINLYLDGQFYASGGSYSPYTFVNPQFLIGLRHPAAAGGNGLLSGDVALAEVFSTALSGSEIATLYSQGNGATPVPEPASAVLMLTGPGLVRMVRRRRA
jgi:hypothetical protein